ncbi:tetratricopeptide repeat protein [Candidatus Poribacteria bacterium]|nr:tetratricopeptide repeat protein [Candidatus Poribacteria bacterium]
MKKKYNLLNFIITFISIFILNFIFSGCAAKRLPVFPIAYEEPKLEITKAELKKKEDEEEKQKQKDITSKSIELVRAILIETSTPQTEKFANDKLNEGKNWLKEAENLLKLENFSEALKASERARLEINNAAAQSKIKFEENRKKEEEERKKKESEETAKKAEEARKLREKTLISELVNNAKSKTTKAITPEINRYLPQNAEKINTLLHKAELSLNNEDFNKVKEETEEINKLIGNLESELNSVLEKINGKEIFDNIKKLIEAKNFGEVYFKLRKYVRDFPDSIYIPESYFFIGVCYEEFDNYDRSRETFNFIISNYPNSDWASQAKDHLEIDLKNKFLKKAQENKGIKEQQNKNLSEKPKEEIKEVVQTKSNNITPLQKKEEINKMYTEALDLLLKEKQVEKAREKFEILLVSPNNPLIDNVLYWMGETYYSQHDYDKAIEYFQKVTTNNIKGNKEVAAQFKMGLSYYNQKKLNEALEALNTLQIKYPNSELNKETKKIIDIINKEIKK